MRKRKKKAADRPMRTYEVEGLDGTKYRRRGRKLRYTHAVVARFRKVRKNRKDRKESSYVYEIVSWHTVEERAWYGSHIAEHRAREYRDDVSEYWATAKPVREVK